MEDESHNLLSTTINRTAFNALWERADDIERRFLSLALRLDINTQGWTVDGYTDTEILNLMQYPPSSVSRKRLKQIMARYKAEGVLDTHPPRGHRRRLRFTFVTSATSTRPSQQTMPTVIPDPPKGDPGSHSAAAAPPSTDQGESPSNVIGDPTKSDPGSHKPGSGITSVIDSDLDDDQKNSETASDQSDQDAHMKAEALSDVGVSLKAFPEVALRRLAAMSLVQVRTVILNAYAGAQLGPVKKPEGFIATCIENYEGVVSTTHLTAWHEHLAALAAQREVQAAARVEEAYLNSPEYLGELARFRAEREAAQQVAQREYERERATYEALLARAERVAPGSFWHMRWLMTLNSLETQLHRATINSWISGSEPVGFLVEGSQEFLIVRVRGQNSRDWLDQRLYGLMRGVLATNARRGDIQIKFVAEPEPPHPNAIKPEWMIEAARLAS